MSIFVFKVKFVSKVLYANKTKWDGNSKIKKSFLYSFVYSSTHNLHLEMTLGVPCIESVNRNGKSFCLFFLFSIYFLVAFAFFHKSRWSRFSQTFIFSMCRGGKRKFIKSAIKMISTSFFHPLIFFFFFTHFFSFSRRKKINALNTQFFSLLFSVIILFRHHESLTSWLS